MTSDGILLTREPLMLDRKEEMLSGWRLRSRFGSLAARTGAATWWRVGFPSEMGWTGSIVHGYPPLRAEPLLVVMKGGG